MGRKTQTSVITFLGKLRRARGRQLRCDAVSFGTVVKLCSKDLQWQQSLGCLNEVASRAVRLRGAVLVNGVLSTLSGAARWAAAQELVAQGFTSLRCSVITANSLMSTYQRAQQWPRAFAASRHMAQRALGLDVVTQNALIHSSWRLGLAYRRLTHPTAVTLGSLISAPNEDTAKRPSVWGRCLQFFAQVRHFALQLSVVLCNAALTACEKGCRWALSLALMSSFGVQRVQPNAVSLSALGSALGESDRHSSTSPSLRWRASLELVELAPSMRPTGSRMRSAATATFNVAISAVGDVRHWAQSLHLLERLVMCRLSPSSTTVTAVLSAAGAQAQQLVRRLCHEVRPDTFHLNALLGAHQRRAAWALALQAARGARSSADEVGARAVWGALRLQSWRWSLELLEWFGAKEVATFTSIIDGCQDAWRVATQLFHQLLDLGLQPNLVASNALHASCAFSTAWLQSLHLLRWTRARQVPDLLTATSALSALRGGGPQRWTQVTTLFSHLRLWRLCANQVTFLAAAESLAGWLSRIAGEKMLANGTKAFLGCGYCTEAFPERNQPLGSPYRSVPAPLPQREHRLQQAPHAAITKNFPLSEVNRHCIPEDCWVALNGKVYDLTEFMDRHPGGPTTILAWAGKDASKFFNDIHKGVKIDSYLRPEAFLGDLGVDESLMSESFWHTLREARITEVKEELNRILGKTATRRRHADLGLGPSDSAAKTQTEAKLQRMETQKRAALDAGDYEKAAKIKKDADEIFQKPVELKKSGDIPLSEVAQHNKPHDCWIAINNTVYDLTDFLQHHPEQRNSILAWAGRDATPMWDKIPGRFPSKNWMEFYMRPEAEMGKVAAEASMSAKEKEDIQAAKTAAAKVPGTADMPKVSEAARFPKLKDITAGKEFPFFSRAEVAKKTGPEEPFMIIHNRVYDLRPLLGNHPGGDEILTSKAGTDCTKEFEVFEHSEKARVRRDQELLVGDLLPAEHLDWDAEAKAEVASGGDRTGSDLALYMKYKVFDALVAFVCIYIYRTSHHMKPLSLLTYSRALRHLHLLMALGIFGALGTAQAAAYSNGQNKRKLLILHKQLGIGMLLGLVARALVRLRSGIPPRFPGNKLVQMVETQSLRFFYAIMLALPLTGMASEYYLKWASSESPEDDRKNDQAAQNAISLHKSLGKLFQFAWLPFHLGYTTLYHASKGRGVVRKVSCLVCDHLRKKLLELRTKSEQLHRLLGRLEHGLGAAAWEAQWSGRGARHSDRVQTCAVPPCPVPCSTHVRRLARLA
ncbi:unnamed protein product [Durusdinium trenchii]|uniref:Cytochrome b5 heme-binding domain-containing protein n=1 Tax=Durusdinium trenchii TaxID=1381693 RepID=A0ABP0M470_9DINO